MSIERIYLLNVIVGIAFLAIGFADNVYADDFILSDAASCTGLPGGGETWNVPTSTCSKTSNLSITSGNTLTITNGVTLAFPSDDNLINRGTITNNGIINNTEGQIINRNSGIFTNSGIIILNGTGNGDGQLINRDTSSFTNLGTITIEGNAGTSGRLTNQNNALLINSGTITIDGISSNSGQLRNLNSATITNSGTFTVTGITNPSGLIINDSVLTNSGLLTTNYNFDNDDNDSSITNSGTIQITDNLDNSGGLISNNCGEITFATISGNPIQEETCPSSSSSTAYEDPTIGKSHNGKQMVEDGICIDEKCWTVTAAYHQDFELVEMLSDSTHIISTTVFCQNGVNMCNYVAFGVSPYGTNINDSIWKVTMQKDHRDNWEMSVIDPEKYLGEVTYTTQIVNDNRFLSASATIEFIKSTPGMILNVEVRDSGGGYRDFKFNDGVAILDSYVYPEIEAFYEDHLEIEPLCLNANPDKRYTCAFEKTRQQALIDAQIAYEELIAKQHYSQDLN